MVLIPTSLVDTRGGIFPPSQDSNDTLTTIGIAMPVPPEPAAVPPDARIR